MRDFHNKLIRECDVEEIKLCANDTTKVKQILKEGSFYTEDGSYGQQYDKDYFEWLGLGTSYRMVQAEKHRRKTMYDRVKVMIATNKALFLTLTFNNETLLRNNTESLARLVKKYLKSQCVMYVANIDFGTKNQRIHFHAVCVPCNNSIDFSLWHKFGAINSKHVRSPKDYKRLAKYITKLTMHSLKNNGFYNRLIYSKGGKNIIND